MAWREGEFPARHQAIVAGRELGAVAWTRSRRSGLVEHMPQRAARYHCLPKIFSAAAGRSCQIPSTRSSANSSASSETVAQRDRSQARAQCRLEITECADVWVPARAQPASNVGCAPYVAITWKRVNCILDCDIRGLSHEWLLSPSSIMR
jgi:hypothetical protein